MYPLPPYLKLFFFTGPRNYGKSIEWKLEGDPWVSEGLYSDNTRGIYLLCLILQVQLLPITITTTTITNNNNHHLYHNHQLLTSLNLKIILW